MYKVEEEKFTFTLPRVTRKRVEEIAQIEVLNDRLRHWTGILLVSSGLGMAAGLCGLAMSMLSLLGFVPRDGGVSILAAIFLVCAFPLLWLAAHCLDKTDKIENEIRHEFCMRYGLEDADR